MNHLLFSSELCFLVGLLSRSALVGPSYGPLAPSRGKQCVSASKCVASNFWKIIYFQRCSFSIILIWLIKFLFYFYNNLQLISHRKLPDSNVDWWLKNFWNLNFMFEEEVGRNMKIFDFSTLIHIDFFQPLWSDRLNYRLIDSIKSFHIRVFWKK